MTSPPSISRIRRLCFPPLAPAPSKLRGRLRQAWGVLVLPYTLARATWLGTPGMAARLRCVGLGARALRNGKPRQALALASNPMDSVRYFELGLVRQVVAEKEPAAYLDVSSPRLVPLMTLEQHGRLTADIINPINSDLADTMELAGTLGFSSRCRPVRLLIEDASYPAARFDLITSISVVEHIPDDLAAIASMWRLLAPGGRLLITVPCAREACEELTNVDEYGLFQSGEDGFVFWQRYYDGAALADRIWSVTGKPNRVWIYGERTAGAYDANVMQKRTRPDYPFWREPIMMAREWRHFDRVDDLPGMGIVGMEFIKGEAA